MTGRRPPRSYPHADRRRGRRSLRSPNRPSLAFRRLRALTLLVLLVVLVSGVVHVARGRAADDTGPVVAPARAAVAVPPPSPTATIEQAVQTWHAREQGRLAVAVIDLATGSTAAYGATTHPFAAASIVKVDILATLLLQKNGKLSGGQRASAERMIRQSSNGDASRLWKQIGKEKGLDAANARFGLTATKGGTRGRWGATTTTTADQLRLLRVVFTDASPLDSASRRYLVSLMGHVAVDQDWGVSAADTRTDGGFRVKNGWLPRSGGWVVNSIGAVEHGGHPLLVVALSDGGASQKRGIAVVELASSNAAKAVTGV